jgi:hypothetical protein
MLGQSGSGCCGASSGVRAGGAAMLAGVLTCGACGEMMVISGRPLLPIVSRRSGLDPPAFSLSFSSRPSDPLYRPIDQMNRENATQLIKLVRFNYRTSRAFALLRVRVSVCGCPAMIALVSPSNAVRVPGEPPRPARLGLDRPGAAPLACDWGERSGRSSAVGATIAAAKPTYPMPPDGGHERRVAGRPDAARAAPTRPPARRIASAGARAAQPVPKGRERSGPREHATAEPGCPHDPRRGGWWYVMIDQFRS